MFKKYSLALLLLPVLTACEGLLNVNNDPGKIAPNQVTMPALLAPGIQFTSTAYYDASSYGAYYTQHLAGHGGQAANIDAYNPYGFDALWQSAYLNALPNLKELERLAAERGSNTYLGIAKVLIALNLQQSTDVFGDIPYSQAFQGVGELNPSYDPQSEIYTVHLKNLLDEAIAQLEQPAPAQTNLRPGTDDLVYNGDQAKWLRAAYSLRARYYLHLSKKDPANLQRAAADADKGINDKTGASDVDLEYPGDALNSNPWFTLISNQPLTARSHKPGAYLINNMNGSAAGAFPGVVDPRLPKYADNRGAATYVGRPVGVADPQAVAAGTNVDITTNTYYGARTSPVLILTYSETQFIKAEATFDTDRAVSYAAYLEGIRGSMTKVGVAVADINTYINNPMISKGAENLTLSDIMVQKYIAMYLQLETWTDMRRYNYDPTIYKNLTPPAVNRLNGQWVQRGNYPDNEPGRNTSLPSVGPQSEKMWLFQ